MHIREATQDDVAAIVTMLADDDLGRLREIAKAPLDDAYLAAFEAIDADPNNRLVLLEDQGEIVGTLQVTFIPNLTFRGGWRAQIEGVRTAAARRGEGLGRQLLEWAIETAARQGCHLIQLTTNSAREDARRFYESFGFQATHAGMKLYLTGDVGGR